VASGAKFVQHYSFLTFLHLRSLVES